MPFARGGMGSAVFAFGHFLVMGGETRVYPRDDRNAIMEKGVYPQTLLYDPESSTWTQGPDMPTPRHGVYPVYDATTSKVFVIGGGLATGFSQSTAVEVLHLGGGLCKGSAMNSFAQARAGYLHQSSGHRLMRVVDVVSEEACAKLCNAAGMVEQCQAFQYRSTRYLCDLLAAKVFAVTAATEGESGIDNQNIHLKRTAQWNYEYQIFERVESCAGRTSAHTITVTQSAKSCSQLRANYTKTITQQHAQDISEPQWSVAKGFVGMPNPRSVCGAARVNTRGTCFAADSVFTHTEANDVCHALGARLCTVKDLAAGAGYKTGCGLMRASLWTGDACEQGHWVVNPTAEYGKWSTPTCLGDDVTAHFQCCADTDVSSASPAAITTAITTAQDTTTVAPPKTTTTGVEGAAAGVTPVVPPAKGTCSYQPGFDWAGADLHHAPLYEDFPASCAKYCLLNAKCFHFTHLNGRCFLKSHAVTGMAPMEDATGALCRVALRGVADLKELPEVNADNFFNNQRQSCTSLGWARGVGQAAGGVCASSKINGKCYSAVPFKTAVSVCKSVGARLCSTTELAMDVARGTGCNANKQLVWTRDACSGGFVVAGGSSTHKDNGEIKQCRSLFEDYSDVHVRCCTEEAIPAVQQVDCGLARYKKSGRPSKLHCTREQPYAQACTWVTPTKSHREPRCMTHAAAAAAKLAEDKDRVPLANIPRIGGYRWGKALPLELFEPQGLTVGGFLYVFGGFVGGYKNMTRRGFALSAATGDWDEIAAMPLPEGAGITHCGQTVDTRTGDIYLVGGITVDADKEWPNAQSVDTVYVYHTSTNTWSTDLFPPIPADRGGGGAVVIGDRLHFFGGGTYRAGSDFVADFSDHWSISLRDPTEGWSFKAPMSRGRNHIGAVVVKGEAYAIGGQVLHNELDGNLDLVERYNANTNTWAKVASLPKGLGHISPGVFAYGGSANQDSDGSEETGLFVLGGTSDMPDRDEVSLVYYDVEHDMWDEQASLVPYPSQVAGLVGDQVLVQVANYSYTGTVVPPL